MPWISAVLYGLLNVIGALLAYLPDHPQLVIAILTILAAGWRRGHVTGSFRQGLLATMLRADKAWKDGELGDINGPQLMDLVINYAETKLAPSVPADMRWLFTPERIRREAHYLYTDAQLLLNGGKLFEDGAITAPASPQTSTPALALYSAAIPTIDLQPKISPLDPAIPAPAPAPVAVTPITVDPVPVPAPIAATPVAVDPVAAAAPDPSPVLMATQTAAAPSPL